MNYFYSTWKFIKKLIRKKTKKIFRNFFMTQGGVHVQWDLQINTHHKILRRLRYKNVHVYRQKNALRLSIGYMTKNALKSPQGIESGHPAHHSTRLDEFFQIIYRTCSAFNPSSAFFAVPSGCSWNAVPSSVLAVPSAARSKFGVPSLVLPVPQRVNSR